MRENPVRELDAAGLTPTLPSRPQTISLRGADPYKQCVPMIDWGTVETPDLARTTNVPALPRGTAAGPAARTTVTIWERKIRESFKQLKERYQPIPQKG